MLLEDFYVVVWSADTENESFYFPAALLDLGWGVEQGSETCVLSQVKEWEKMGAPLGKVYVTDS